MTALRVRNPPGPSSLTPQQELFVKEYLVDLNATAAWIRAGGNPLHADRVASKIMRKGTLVQVAIARALAERSVRVGITADRVLEEVAKLAFGDPRVLFREDGSLKAPHEYDRDDAAMIEGIKTRRIVEIGLDPDNPDKQKLMPVEIQEVKLTSKAGALGMLMRHLGLNNDKLDVTLNMPLNEALQAAYKRTGMARPVLEHDDKPTSVVEGEFEEVDDEPAEVPNPDDIDLDEMLK